MFKTRWDQASGTGTLRRLLVILFCTLFGALIPAVECAPSPKPQPLTLTLSEDPVLAEADPEGQYYVFRLNGLDVGLFSVKGGQLVEGLLLDSTGGKSLNFKQVDTGFLDSASWDLLALPFDGEHLKQSIYDKDGDGIPEVKVTTDPFIIHDLDEIHWRQRQPSTRPHSATRPSPLDQRARWFRQRSGQYGL